MGASGAGWSGNTRSQRLVVFPAGAGGRDRAQPQPLELRRLFPGGRRGRNVFFLKNHARRSPRRKRVPGGRSGRGYGKGTFPGGRCRRRRSGFFHRTKGVPPAPRSRGERRRMGKPGRDRPPETAAGQGAESTPYGIVLPSTRQLGVSVIRASG